MNDAAPESPSDAVLRRHFPALYITLVSIVVALAVEGLLGRLGELQVPELNLEAAILVAQVAQFIGMASLFWWVSARWITSIPWPFGVFDGLSCILAWLLSTGVFTLSVGFVYRWNGYRGIVYTGRSPKVAKLHRIPSVMLVSLGVGFLSLVGWLRGDEPGAVAQLAILIFTIVFMAAFAYTDLRIWKVASDEPGRFADSG